MDRHHFLNPVAPHVRFTLAGAALLMSVCGARLLAQTPVQLEALPGSRITVSGSTTVGASWHCTATPVSATAVVADGASPNAPGNLRSVHLAVPVADLQCQSSAMKRAMLDAMRGSTDSGRTILGFFTPDRAGQPRRDSVTQMCGTLIVAGVPADVAFDATVHGTSGDTVVVHASLDLAMTTFGVTPPRVLLGLVRARNDINVTVDLAFRTPRPPRQ